MSLNIKTDGTLEIASKMEIRSGQTLSIGTVQFTNNATGGGVALLGANSPAGTLSAPFTWLRVVSNDGSTVYVPAWK